jgi:hypothetical protein
MIAIWDILCTSTREDPPLTFLEVVDNRLSQPCHGVEALQAEAKRQARQKPRRDFKRVRDSLAEIEIERKAVGR